MNQWMNKAVRSMRYLVIPDEEYSSAHIWIKCGDSGQLLNHQIESIKLSKLCKIFTNKIPKKALCRLAQRCVLHQHPTRCEGRPLSYVISKILNSMAPFGLHLDTSNTQWESPRDSCVGSARREQTSPRYGTRRMLPLRTARHIPAV